MSSQIKLTEQQYREYLLGLSKINISYKMVTNEGTQHICEPIDKCPFALVLWTQGQRIKQVMKGTLGTERDNKNIISKKLNNMIKKRKKQSI